MPDQRFTMDEINAALPTLENLLIQDPKASVYALPLILTERRENPELMLDMDTDLLLEECERLNEERHAIPRWRFIRRRRADNAWLGKVAALAANEQKRMESVRSM